MWVCAHTPLALGSQVCQVGNQSPALVKQFLGLVTLHPLLKQSQMLWMPRHLRERHLVRPPRVFRWLAVDYLGSRPALGRAQDDHGPDWSAYVLLLSRSLLDRLDFKDRPLHLLRHQLVH